jgi:hypothetical protein
VRALTSKGRGIEEMWERVGPVGGLGVMGVLGVLGGWWMGEMEEEDVEGGEGEGEGAEGRRLRAEAEGGDLYCVRRIEVLSLSYSTSRSLLLIDEKDVSRGSFDGVP